MINERTEVSADASPSRGRALLEQHFPLIHQRLERLGRFSGLPEHEAEEFRSWALFKLVENDYRILASWEGRSSFSTFLGVVLVNLMRDYRTHIWGKWRPSAAACRLGPEAVLLERLCVRDGLPLEEAIERMRTGRGVSLSQAELERMAVSIRRSTTRRRVSEEELLGIPVDGEVERRIEEAERACTEERLRELLPPLLSSLPDWDRLLLKLHYWDGLSMASISPILDRPPRELFSRRDKCLKRLWHYLKEAGLSPEQVRELPGCLHLDLTPMADETFSCRHTSSDPSELREKTGGPAGTAATPPLPVNRLSKSNAPPSRESSSRASEKLPPAQPER